MGLTPFITKTFRGSDGVEDRTVEDRTNEKVTGRRGSNTNGTTTAESEAVKSARAALTKAQDGVTAIMNIRNDLAEIISQVSSLCVQKPSKWRKQVADLLGKKELALSTNVNKALHSIGNIFTGGMNEVVFQIVRAKAVNDICKDLSSPNSRFKTRLAEIDNQIIQAKAWVSDLQQDFNEIVAIENQYQLDKAKAEAEANLAQTASERARKELEIKQLETQKKAELDKLKLTQEANLQLQKERTKKIIIIGAIGAAVLIALGYSFFKKS